MEILSLEILSRDILSLEILSLEIRSPEILPPEILSPEIFSSEMASEPGAPPPTPPPQRLHGGGVTYGTKIHGIPGQTAGGPFQVVGTAGWGELQEMLPYGSEPDAGNHRDAPYDGYPA